VLLIVDPTGDLPGAAAEGAALQPISSSNKAAALRIRFIVFVLQDIRTDLSAQF
jgi:hypothetical protein